MLDVNFLGIFLTLLTTFLVPLAIACAAAYFVIKAAVKRGAMDAFEELKKAGKL